MINDTIKHFAEHSQKVDGHIVPNKPIAAGQPDKHQQFLQFLDDHNNKYGDKPMVYQRPDHHHHHQVIAFPSVVHPYRSEYLEGDSIRADNEEVVNNVNDEEKIEIIERNDGGDESVGDEKD